VRESDFQAQVVDLAKMLGWNVWWTKYSLHSPKGLPDLIMTRGGRLVLAELKVNAKVTPEQCESLWAFACTGAEVFCWRPGNWPQIERVLAREKKVIVELSPYRNGGE
jgi:Holliday junction resolvase